MKKKNIKRDQGMLDLTKLHFPANFHTFMMNISHDFNGKLMLVKFKQFSPKAHLHIVVVWFFGFNSSNIHHLSMKICGEVYHIQI